MPTDDNLHVVGTCDRPPYGKSGAKIEIVLLDEPRPNQVLLMENSCSPMFVSNWLFPPTYVI